MSEDDFDLLKCELINLWDRYPNRFEAEARKFLEELESGRIEQRLHEADRKGRGRPKIRTEINLLTVWVTVEQRKHETPRHTISDICRFIAKDGGFLKTMPKGDSGPEVRDNWSTIKRDYERANAFIAENPKRRLLWDGVLKDCIGSGDSEPLKKQILNLVPEEWRENFIRKLAPKPGQNFGTTFSTRQN